MPPCHAGRKSVNTIAQCGHHLIELLNNILDFEKVGAANFTLECVPFSVACEADKVRDVLLCAPHSA
jgi:signal transduction histidine kinase